VITVFLSERCGLALISDRGLEVFELVVSHPSCSFLSPASTASTLQAEPRFQ